MSGYRSFIEEAHTEIQSKDFTAFLSAFENMAKLGNHKDPIESRSSIVTQGSSPVPGSSILAKLFSHFSDEADNLYGAKIRPKSYALRRKRGCLTNLSSGVTMRCR
jgi:hypothetical protein